MYLTNFYTFDLTNNIIFFDYTPVCIVSKHKTSLPSLSSLGINNSSILYQLSADALHKITLQSNQGVETSSGTLAVNTGEFTGRSPMDRFIVKMQ